MSGAPFLVPASLADPMLRLYSGATPIDENTNWHDSNPAARLRHRPRPCLPNPGQSTAPPGCTGCTNEAAILTTLAPGGYTVFLFGADGGSGLGLVEVFEIG